MSVNSYPSCFPALVARSTARPEWWFTQRTGFLALVVGKHRQSERTRNDTAGWLSRIGRRHTLDSEGEVAITQQVGILAFVVGTHRQSGRNRNYTAGCLSGIGRRQTQTVREMP